MQPSSALQCGTYVEITLCAVVYLRTYRTFCIPSITELFYVIIGEGVTMYVLKLFVVILILPVRFDGYAL